MLLIASGCGDRTNNAGALPRGEMQAIRLMGTALVQRASGQQLATLEARRRAIAAHSGRVVQGYLEGRVDQAKAEAAAPEEVGYSRAQAPASEEPAPQAQVVHYITFFMPRRPPEHTMSAVTRSINTETKPRFHFRRLR